jgi:transcriptional regulator with XRE-family HTH domain
MGIAISGGFMASFGKLLRDFRLQAGLSQRALAQAAKVDTSYISRLESGEREIPSRSLALVLAEILRLSQQESDLWLISAGFISPRMQDLASSGISKLMEHFDITLRDSANESIDDQTETRRD